MENLVFCTVCGPFKSRHLLGGIRVKIKDVFRNFSLFRNFRTLISAQVFHCIETKQLCTENQKAGSYTKEKNG